MSYARIERIIYNDKQTLGIISAYTGKTMFMAKTLELAWKDNQPNISCIPKGIYKVAWTRSNRLSAESEKRWRAKNTGEPPDEVKSVYAYEVLNVPNRSGIRIHSANFFYQLLGCIALGSQHKDINLDQQLDVVHSGATVKQFEQVMNRQGFVLEIV